MPVECEKCGHKASYPLSELRAMTALCESCGCILEQIGSQLAENDRNHRLDMWPFYFKIEALEIFDIDLDEVGDEEFDQILSVRELQGFLLSKREEEASILKQLYEMKTMTSCRDSVSFEEFVNCKIEELAEKSF